MKHGRGRKICCEMLLKVKAEAKVIDFLIYNECQYLRKSFKVCCFSEGKLFDWVTLNKKCEMLRVTTEKQQRAIKHKCLLEY